MKIINTGRKIEMPKRCYIPVKVSDECSECGTEYTDNLSDHYLMYPVTNDPYEMRFYCEKCDEEWTRSVKLIVTLEEVE